MSQPPKPKVTRAVRYLRGAMLLAALALPILSLTVFGSLWLWQNGYVLYWAISALFVTTIAFGLERWLLRDLYSNVRSGVSQNEEAVRFATAREDDAWKSVLKLAETLDVDTIDSRDALFDLGKRTVETVARQMHPEHKEPLLKFTLPELLALIERVSSELGPFVRETIPLGDRLTVGQFLAIYRWRGLLDVADKAYDIWRIMRILNPATAVAQELREKFTRQFYDWGRKELARKLTTAYVREVGRGAIDLYSGRLREHGLNEPASEDIPTTSEEIPEKALAEAAHRRDELTDERGKPMNKPKVKPKRFAGTRRVLGQATNAAKVLLRRKSDDALK